MYEPGDLKVYVPCPTAGLDGLCNCENELHSNVYDARGDTHAPVAIGSVYLPHSCDAWVIGGVDEIKALIADLGRARDTIELGDA